MRETSEVDELRTRGAVASTRVGCLPLWGFLGVFFPFVSFFREAFRAETANPELRKRKGRARRGRGGGSGARPLPAPGWRCREAPWPLPPPLWREKNYTSRRAPRGVRLEQTLR